MDHLEKAKELLYGLTSKEPGSLDPEVGLSIATIVSNYALIAIAEQLEKMNVKPERGCKRGHIVREMGCPYCLVIDPDKYPLADGYCPNCYANDCHCINTQEDK